MHFDHTHVSKRRARVPELMPRGQRYILVCMRDSVGLCGLGKSSDEADEADERSDERRAVSHAYFGK